jgi:hypothetical protein
LEINAMKTTLFALCFLCATAAFGQSGTAVLSNNLQFSNHTERAAPAGMSLEQNLWGSGSVTMAQGEQPVGEVVPETYEMPLGDAARIQRKEHAADKKSQVVWENRAWGSGLALSTERHNPLVD